MTDFLANESIKQSAPLSLKKFTLVPETEHKAMNCENIETEYQVKLEAGPVGKNSSYSEEVEKIFIGFVDSRIANINSGPSTTLNEAEDSLFGPVEFELFEQWLLDEKKPINRKVEEKE